MRLRHILERGFFLLEPLITGLVYAFCLVREVLGRKPAVPVLMYHQVGRPLNGIKFGQDRVSPERFQTQVGVLLRSGYQILSLGSLVERLEEATPENLGRCVVLTFDDGFCGQFQNAFPVLRRHGVSATFFVPTGYVGKKSVLPHLLANGEEPPNEDPSYSEWLPLSWFHLSEMARHGMEIGSHSVSHRSLGCLSPEEVEREVRLSKEILEERLHCRVDLFAYPFGSESCGDFNPAIEKILRAAGYRAACTTVVGRNRLVTDTLALRRIPVEEGDGPFRLRCKLVGAYDWVGRVKATWQRLITREERVDVLPVETDWEEAKGA